MSPNGPPGAGLHNDPRNFAVDAFDPTGYNLDAVYKSWQKLREGANVPLSAAAAA